MIHDIYNYSYVMYNFLSVRKVVELLPNLENSTQLILMSIVGYNNSNLHLNEFVVIFHRIWVKRVLFLS